MLFSSLTFLWVFLPIVFFGYRLLKEEYRNVFLLLASLVFYAWGEPVYIFLMLLSVGINYVLGLIVADTPYKRSGLIACVAVNLALLGFFKYYNFAAEIVNNIAAGEVLPIRHIVLPIGISFYTFQILSYVIDVYRGDAKVQHSFTRLALYVSLFPQLIAGPIVKYHDVDEQIEQRTISEKKTASGIARFACGLGKKVIISNTMAEIVDTVFALPTNQLSTGLAWIGAVFYALQIYYDFSGYSDMAIGLGRMFGFEFLENFNIPYISQSIQEFWRRWHISLSTWFKQYLYIPLGGNRKGRIRTYVNLCIVFFATGLWHGASYTFILWGMFHGFFQVMERLFLGKWLKKNPIKLINHVYTLLVVLIGWVFFRAETLAYAFDYLQVMFTMQKSTIWSCMELVDRKAIIIAAAGLLLCGPIQKTPIFVWLKTKKDTHVGFAAVGISVVLIMVYSILSLVSGAYNPFIYFRF
ncbi:MAG: MBOAT family protein [Clostridia bacterium]|nr:MBOAT family protein [Clostridia bacterium]